MFSRETGKRKIFHVFFPVSNPIAIPSTKMGRFHGQTRQNGPCIHGNGVFLWTGRAKRPLHPREWGVSVDGSGKMGIASTEMGCFHGRVGQNDHPIHGNGAFPWTEPPKWPMHPQKWGVFMDGTAETAGGNGSGGKKGLVVGDATASGAGSRRRGEGRGGRRRRAPAPGPPGRGRRCHRPAAACCCCRSGGTGRCSGAPGASRP